MGEKRSLLDIFINVKFPAGAGKNNSELKFREGEFREKCRKEIVIAVGRRKIYLSLTEQPLLALLEEAKQIRLGRRCQKQCHVRKIKAGESGFEPSRQRRLW